MAGDEKATGTRPAIFRDKPHSIKTLRAFYKAKLINIDAKSTNVDVDSFVREVMEESDRSVIILIGTPIDGVLLFAIFSKLSFKPNDKEMEHIFRFEGPLGTFSSRLEIARLFGIIDDGLYQQIDAIKELRNACAHSRHVLTFSDTVIINVIQRILTPLEVIAIPMMGAANIKMRVIFETMIIILTFTLGSREAALAQLRGRFEVFLSQNSSRDK
jgi:hypothetical protein